MPNDKTGLQISAVQVAASALASLSGAIVASFFGVAGTIIGAAVVSVIATVAASLYAHSIRSTHGWLQGRLAAGDEGGKQSVHGTKQPKHRIGSDTRQDTFPRNRLGPGAQLSRLRDQLSTLSWRHVAIVASGAFVLAVAAI
ncbi:MAG: hypothetical protein ACRD1G_12730, partial [Acidimicrobiales bacterium]